MIDNYKLNVVQGQALNLLMQRDESFFDRFMESEEGALEEWKNLQIAIHVNGMKSNVIKSIAEHPILSTQLDARLKMQIKED